MGGGRIHHGRIRRVALVALALYALVVVASSVLHHDLACHLTSPTHCTACTATLAAPRADQPPEVVPSRLSDAAWGEERRTWVAQDGSLARIPTRAPPA